MQPHKIGDRVEKLDYPYTGTIKAIEISGSPAYVKWDNPAHADDASWEPLDLLYPEGRAPRILEVHDWARWPEVLEYANNHGLTPTEAIRELVNAGLSHLEDE